MGRTCDEVASADSRKSRRRLVRPKLGTAGIVQHTRESLEAYYRRIR